MSPGLLAVLLLAQAEAAPPPAGTGPRPGVGASEERGASGLPAAPSPDARGASGLPAPADGGAEADPTPPRAPSPVAPAVILEDGPAYFAGLAFGGARRLEPQAGEVPPAYGFAVSTELGGRYATFGRLELSLAFHFAYERYRKTVQLTLVQDGADQTYDDQRTVSYFDFSAVQRAALRLGPVVPFAAVGGGLGIGYFSTREPPYRPGDARAARPVVRAAAGLDVDLPGSPMSLGLELALAWLPFRPQFTTETGQSLAVFGSRMNANLWLRTPL